jgi:hypothetical protein
VSSRSRSGTSISPSKRWRRSQEEQPGCQRRRLGTKLNARFSEQFAGNLIVSHECRPSRALRARIVPKTCALSTDAVGSCPTHGRASDPGGCSRSSMKATAGVGGGRPVADDRCSRLRWLARTSIDTAEPGDRRRLDLVPISSSLIARGADGGTGTLPPCTFIGGEAVRYAAGDARAGRRHRLEGLELCRRPETVDAKSAPRWNTGPDDLRSACGV